MPPLKDNPSLEEPKTGLDMCVWLACVRVRPPLGLRLSRSRVAQGTLRSRLNIVCRQNQYLSHKGGPKEITKKRDKNLQLQF